MTQAGGPARRKAPLPDRAADAAAADAPADPGFLAAVLEGLAHAQKRLPCVYLYDAAGSRLFDRICGLAEYYPTRTETAILRANAGRVAGLAPADAALVELGSGSSTKTRHLIDALPGLAAYVPVDISAGHLQAAAARLRKDYPRLDIHPVVADFTGSLRLPDGLCAHPKLLFFPGSTIGNFEPAEAQALLGRLRALPNVTGLVIGVDLQKDPALLVAAYDDAKGVTAAFNLNLLMRINRELGGDFDPAGFAHEARWNPERGRIEMHLRSLRPQRVRIAGLDFRFGAGETIHTENAHKYTPGGFRDLASGAGWATREVWTDEAGLFSVHVLTPARAA